MKIFLYIDFRGAEKSPSAIRQIFGIYVPKPKRVNPFFGKGVGWYIYINIYHPIAED